MSKASSKKVGALLSFTVVLWSCATFQSRQSVPPVTGYIIQQTGNEVLTDLGHNQVQRGDTLIVFDVESEVCHPVTGELVRVLLNPVGIIRLDEVGDISSSGQIVSGGNDIEVGHFARLVSKKHIPRESWWEEGTWWVSLNQTGLPRKPNKESVPLSSQPLFRESFDEQNGVKCNALSGEYAHSKSAAPLIIPLDTIGLVGSSEYTVEFYWLPEEPRITSIDAILFKNLSVQGPAIRCYVGPEGQEWHNVVFEVNDYPIRLHVVRATHYRSNRWQHLVLTGDFLTGKHYLYVNGVEKGIQIHGYSDDGWRNTEISFVTQSGLIDDIAIYDRHLQAPNSQ